MKRKVNDKSGAAPVGRQTVPAPSAISDARCFSAWRRPCIRLQNLTGNRRTATLALLVIAAGLLTACSKTDPQKALEAAVQQLQDHLEAKDSKAVLAMLDTRFRAQDEYDAEWARKTMALMFLRHANVKVIAVTRSSRIDPPGSSIGITEAQVLFTGAQGLIPERASPYSVQLQWALDGSDWKLRDVRWE